MNQTKQATILVVDDDAANRKLLESMLTAEGHAVRTAASGEEALAAVAAQLPALILLDIMMPGIDGFEVTRRLKADSRSHLVPIILVTSLEDRESRLKGLDAGAEEFITKPVDRAELQIRVRNLLKLKEYQDFLAGHNRILEEQVRERTAALQYSEEKFRKISESAQDAIIMMGADQCISFWNAAATRIFGYTAAEAMGQELHALIVPAPDHAKFSQAFPHFQETGEGSIIGKVRELTALRKGGEEFPVELSVSATQLNGQWHAIGIVRNITERKRAEESLRTSQARFSTIFNQAPLGIALIDSFTGKIYEVNPRFAEIAGRTIEEMTTIDWMSITHPDDVQEDLDNMALLNAGKIPGFRMDKRYIHPDGSFVWINMTIAPLWVEQNISPRHLCMIEDITERKRVELKLVEQLDELRRWQEVMLGREMRTIEVMREVNELLAQAGQPPRYPSAEQANAAAEGSLRSSGAAPRPTEGRVSGGVPFTGEPTGGVNSAPVSTGSGLPTFGVPLAGE